VRLVFHITRTPDGRLEATKDRLDQGAKGIPMTAIRNPCELPILLALLKKSALLCPATWGHGNLARRR
jgi:hypothetical protein